MPQTIDNTIWQAISHPSPRIAFFGFLPQNFVPSHQWAVDLEWGKSTGQSKGLGSKIWLNCDGLLVDSLTSSGGNTNTGPVAIRFFSLQNRDAICCLINNRDERNNYAIFLSQMNVCLEVSESIDNEKIVNIEKFRQHCCDTVIHLALHFSWVKISPSVHQMLANSCMVWEWIRNLEQAHKKFQKWCWLQIATNICVSKYSWHLCPDAHHIGTSHCPRWTKCIEVTNAGMWNFLCSKPRRSSCSSHI